MQASRTTPYFTQWPRAILPTTYAPEAVAERCGLTPDRIRRIAAELAHAAFEQAFEA